MKRLKQALAIIIIAMLLISIITPASLASGKIDTSKLQGIGNPTGVGALSQASGKIINVIYTVAVFMSVATLVIIGIKYMTSSPDQKASLKDRAIPYLIGSILVFGAANILRFIQSMSTWIK